MSSPGVPDRLHDASRLKAVHSILNTDPETEVALARLVELATRSLRAPVGQVNAVTDNIQISLSSTGPGDWKERRRVSLDLSYCKHATGTGEPVIVGDAREDTQFQNSRAIAGSQVVAYLGVPLMLEPDLVIGAMCVVDFEPREWRDEDVQLLEQLAKFAMAQIARRGVSEAEILRLLSVVASTYDAIISVTVDGVITEWNHGAEAMFGYDRSEMVGQQVRVLVPTYELPRMEIAAEKARRGEQSPRYEAVRLRKDGSEVNVSIVVTPITDLAQRVVGVTAVMRDISDRIEYDKRLREREARFRSLIENSAEVITLLSAYGRVKYDSPAIERVLGYRENERIDTDIATYLHVDDITATQEALAKCVTSGEPVQAEVRVRHKDGSYRTFVATGTNLLSDPAVHGIVVNSLDVTEKRRTEDQLRHAQKMEAIGRLAGGVAHDFNNILTAISGNAHMLLDQLPESEAREEASEILRAASRATDLTRQLLAFSRKQFVQPQVTDPGDVVSSAKKMLGRLLTEEVELVVQIAEDAGLIHADPGQLEQVIMNLVVNARDAMPAGGRVAIEVRSIAVDQRTDVEGDVPGGMYVMIAVSDTGEGMSKAVRDRIFEPFFTTKPIDRGTGLGLSTVYGIVKQNRGFLNVYSEPSQGSTFRIYLPQIEGVSSWTPRPDPVPTDAVGGSETVLLVEDDRDVRKLVCRVLERHGYHVLEAEGPLDALERVIPAYRGPIDLLLTDVVMPAMGGPQLAARIEALRPDIKMIFMSGYTEDEFIRRSASSPRGAFIEKPFTPNTLARKVREILDAHSTE